MLSGCSVAAVDVLRNFRSIEGLEFDNKIDEVGVVVSKFYCDCRVRIQLFWSRRRTLPQMFEHSITYEHFYDWIKPYQNMGRSVSNEATVNTCNIAFNWREIFITIATLDGNDENVYKFATCSSDSMWRSNEGCSKRECCHCMTSHTLNVHSAICCRCVEWPNSAAFQLALIEAKRQINFIAHEVLLDLRNSKEEKKSDWNQNDS